MILKMLLLSASWLLQFVTKGAAVSQLFIQEEVGGAKAAL